MDISKKMQDAFNAQITAELYSSNLYLEMAFWFRKEGWKGFATWMFKQSDEEKDHALKMAEFVLKRGGEARVEAIPAVETNYKDPQNVFEVTMKHEQHVTELIDKLADVADELHDRASANFIATFVDEQVEEEKSVREILDLFRHSDAHAVSKIDDILGARA